MSYFDENAEYDGNKVPILEEGYGRLTARSIKIFADGKSVVCSLH